MKRTGRISGGVKILLSALFMVLLLGVTGIRVEAKDNSMVFTAAGQTQNISYDSSTYKKSESILNITNRSSQRMKLNFTITTRRTSVWPDEKLSQFKLSLDGTETGYVIFEPGESAQLKFDFVSYYDGGTSISVTSELSAIGDNGGRSFQQPQVVALNGDVSGVVGAYNKNTNHARYFVVSTANRHYLTMELASENEGKPVTAWVYNSGDTGMLSPLTKLEARGAAKRDTVFLQPGNYIIKITYAQPTSTKEAYAAYSLKLDGRDYIPATGVSLSCSAADLSVDSGIQNSPKTFTFTATTVPANSDDKLGEILKEGTLDGIGLVSGSLYGSNTGTFNVKYECSVGGYKCGYDTLCVSAGNGVKSAPVEINAKPMQPVLDPQYVIYHDKISFNQSGYRSGYSKNNPVRVYLYNSGKWILKATRTDAGMFTVRGLKADKKYQFRFVGISQKADGSWTEGTPLTKTFKTAKKTKPSIKSVKVSNTKVRVKRKWVWVSNSWYLKKDYYTTFKVTVTLKKKLPGAQGLDILGTRAKGKGTKFTTTVTLAGSQKGKNYNLPICAYYQKGAPGAYGPSVKKRVRLK